MKEFTEADYIVDKLAGRLLEVIVIKDHLGRTVRGSGFDQPPAELAADWLTTEFISQMTYYRTTETFEEWKARKEQGRIQYTEADYLVDKLAGNLRKGFLIPGGSGRYFPKLLSNEEFIPSKELVFIEENLEEWKARKEKE